MVLDLLVDRLMARHPCVAVRCRQCLERPVVTAATVVSLDAALNARIFVGIKMFPYRNVSLGPHTNGLGS
jgi:hypothetical protein